MCEGASNNPKTTRILQAAFPRFEISGSTSGHCLSPSMSHILYCPVTSPCQPILYCKINHLLRRKQIEKKILFQIMSICAKEKRLRHMSQDKTPEYILYMELVIMIDVPPNIFFIFWLIDWLVLMPNRQYISHLPTVHIILETSSSVGEEFSYMLST